MQFRQKVDLRAARIAEIKRHPDAEKLYIETVDLGAEKRTIVSGLVPHYKEEELLGHTVVLVANLKPALLRGVESKGMLLAASEGKTVEVLFVDHAQPGERVTLQGGPAEPAPRRSTSTPFSRCRSRRRVPASWWATQRWNARASRWSRRRWRRAG